MTSYLNGTCKKELKRMVMPVFNGPSFIQPEEQGFNIGDTIYVYLKDDEMRYNDVSTHIYQIRFSYTKFDFTREEIEEHIEIHYEENAYNSCVKNGIPCDKLRGHTEGETSRCKQGDSASCSIGWEVGRGMCRGYEPFTQQSM